MAPTATQRVLNLPELLENILLSVDVPQLFAVHRVNTAFRVTIVQSKPIRRKMLLEESKGEHATNASDLFSTINPLCFEGTTRTGRFHPMIIKHSLLKSGSESQRRLGQAESEDAIAPRKES
ncbi:hypothetical protein LTR37_001246 [Vermiconidia calcicola]|uniref:Uncharacterized protein n=1 Tax=Vermiconidia calcicola TaxID=1690605 RepID=A0ACC3NVY8_9PEZI|nr:hypothetical protein LTR37_001246 [Vermiconidia calcicola]